MRALVLLWGCLALRVSAALTCPKEMSGFEGDSVSLQCTYQEGLRARPKYWCREVGVFISRCSDKIFSGESNQEVTEGRVSIRDSPQELTFTVTLRDLRLQDSGIYWFGAQRLGLDDTSLVSLTVSPDPEAQGQEHGRPGWQHPTRGAPRAGATTKACCPAFPAPSRQAPLATTTSPRLRAEARPTRPPAPTSPDQQPAVVTLQQGHSGAEAATFTETATPRHPASPPDSAATSPPAGSSRPAVVTDPLPAAETPGPVSGSHSSSRSRSLPTARQLAPVLVLLALLLAASLIALGAHGLERRRRALRTPDLKPGEKIHLPAEAPGREEVPSPPSEAHEALALHPPPEEELDPRESVAV